MPYTRRGMRGYAGVQDWRWLYYPPPYQFASAVNAPDTGYFPQYAPAKAMGLGCTGNGDCGCGCKGTGDVFTGLDFSLQSTSLADKVQSLLPISSSISIPNWILYAGLALLIGPKLLGGRRR